jgi:hypothetical protein
MAPDLQMEPTRLSRGWRGWPGMPPGLRVIAPHPARRAAWLPAIGQARASVFVIARDLFKRHSFVTEVKSGVNDMQNYLAKTHMCDHDDPWLMKLAEEMINGAITPVEKARRIFGYVRDRVRFGLAYSRSTATQTLKRGYGDCLSKSNVQVALLRSMDIPARFRWVKVESVILHHLVADFCTNKCLQQHLIFGLNAYSMIGGYPARPSSTNLYMMGCSRKG